MKISYDRGFNAIGVAITFFNLSLGSSVLGVFFCFFLRNSLREYVSATIASIMASLNKILWERFGNILKQSFQNHKNIEIVAIYTIS